MSSEAYPKVYLYRRVVQVKHYIDEHFSEKLDLDAISDEAYFSKYHFLRLFKKQTSETEFPCSSNIFARSILTDIRY
ncbi:MAG: AraC family transcriptional regulator [Bacteroidota bacterium]